MRSRRSSGLVALAAVFAVAGCAQDSPTAPADPAVALNAQGGNFVPPTMPSGERMVGKVAVEPAYNAETGSLMYLLTPEKAPLPSKANGMATSPLYMVVYPPGSTVGTLNCMGLPGNCPDHDGLAASFAISKNPGLYGSNPAAIPGHDHVADPPGGADWNIAWDVIEVVFTNAAAANTHLTTDQQIADAVQAGDAVEYHLGFAFDCASVAPQLYWKGTPVS